MVFSDAQVGDKIRYGFNDVSKCAPSTMYGNQFRAMTCFDLGFSSTGGRHSTRASWSSDSTHYRGSIRGKFPAAPSINRPSSLPITPISKAVCATRQAERSGQAIRQTSRHSPPANPSAARAGSEVGKCRFLEYVASMPKHPRRRR